MLYFCLWSYHLPVMLFITIHLVPLECQIERTLAAHIIHICFQEHFRPLTSAV